MVTLSRNNTDLFYAQRTFTNESKHEGDEIGDWWRSMKSFLSDAAYNAMCDNYNGWEDEADKTPSNLQGTAPDNSNFGIASLPQRPRPIHK